MGTAVRGGKDSDPCIAPARLRVSNRVKEVVLGFIQLHDDRLLQYLGVDPPEVMKRASKE